MSEAGQAAKRSWTDWKIVPTSRRATQWTFSIVGLILVLGILFLVTFLVRLNPVTWDLTEADLHSLSQQTHNVLRDLEEQVTLLGFVEGGEDPRLERMLRAYADRSARVAYRLVDPVARPALAQNYQVRQPGTVVVDVAGQQRYVEEPDEAKLTNAILSTVRGQTVPLCYLVGHGERSLEDRERKGMSGARTVLSQTNYEIRKVNLTTTPEVPDPCRVLIDVAPALDLTEPEVGALRGYLEDGGRMLVLLEPGSRLPNLFALLEERGVRVAGDVVVDTAKNAQAMGMGMEVPVVDEYERHPITDGFRLMTLYPMARSVRPIQPGPEGLAHRILARTSDSSWGETNLEDLGGERQAARWDEGEDIAGPVPLAVAVSTAVEESLAERRRRARAEEPPPVGEPVMVVFGDADFASNGFFDAQGNGDLFVNSVSWLAGEEDLIAIRPKEPQNKRVPLTRERRLAVFFIAVLGLPLLPAVAGIITLVKRVK